MTSVSVAPVYTTSDLKLQNQFTAILIAGLILDIIFVALRCLVRRRSDSGLGIDDGLLVASLGPLLAYVVASLFIQANMNRARHATGPPQGTGQAKGFVEGYLVCMVAYACNTALVKLSILMFYRRIFQTRTVTKIAWGLGTIAIMYNLAFILVAGFQCIPLRAAWTNEPGNCINLNPPLLTLGITNVLMDFTILSIPLRYISSLNMSVSRKVQVAGIFLTGAIACVFSILRVTAVGTVTPDNRIYAQLWSGVVSYTEMFVGVIAACLPSFGKFFRMGNLKPWWRRRHECLSSRFSSSHSSKSNPQSSDLAGKELVSTGLSVSNPKSPPLPHTREVVYEDEDDCSQKRLSPAFG